MTGEIVCENVLVDDTSIVDVETTVESTAEAGAGKVASLMSLVG